MNTRPLADSTNSPNKAPPPSTKAVAPPPAPAPAPVALALRLPPAHAEAELQACATTVVPSARGVVRRRSCVEALVAHASSLSPAYAVPGSSFPGALRLHILGSFSIDASLASSDVDLTILDDSFPEGFHPKFRAHTAGTLYDMRVLAGWLVGSGKFMRIDHSMKARVPCVRFAWIAPDGGKAKVSLTMNDRLGVGTSELVKAYCDLNELARPLILVVKHWAQQRGLSNSAQPDTLNSYALTLLVLSYLQSAKLVSNLQCQDVLRSSGIAHTPTTFAHPSNGGPLFHARDVRFATDAERWFKPVTVSGPTPLLSLLLAFFDWIRLSPPGKWCYSLAWGHTIWRSRLIAMEPDLKLKEQWSKAALIVLDPFQKGLNVTGNVSAFKADEFVFEVCRAVGFLKTGEPWARIARQKHAQGPAPQASTSKAA